MFGPADADSPTGPRQIPIGLVGPSHAADGIRNWLQRCQNHIEAKDTKPGHENLHQPFPGFQYRLPFDAQLVFDDTLVREIPERQLRRIVPADPVSATKDAVDFYADTARSQADTGRCRVVIRARPEELQDRKGHPPSQESAAEREEDQDCERPEATSTTCSRQSRSRCPLPCS